jgi:hypothetical protein
MLTVEIGRAELGRMGTRGDNCEVNACQPQRPSQVRSGVESSGVINSSPLAGACGLEKAGVAVALGRAKDRGQPKCLSRAVW